jgi:mannose-6-phosphate isomerase-like protein (cupin superfamily)
VAVELGVRQPVLLGRDEGEVITDRAERTVRALLDHPLADVTWSRYEPGERGPDPHVHREHADAFYVLAGELAFELGAGAEKLSAEAGTLVLVPQDVIHSFGNESGETTTFLNIHAPGCGFVASLRARRDGRADDAERFDSFDPPGDGGRRTEDVVVRGPGEGAALMGGLLVFKAEGGDGEGTFSLSETTPPPGFAGPPPHRHERTLDSFFVLDGTLTVRVGDDEHSLAPGSYAAVPPGHVHTFANRGDAPVRMLNLMAPGGFEQYLKELAARTPPGERPDPAVMAEIASRFDFTTA